MGRNRNDSSSGNHGGGSYQPPIEQYRKRIGRQDSHKERRHLKQVQHSQEAKSMAPKIYQQAVLIVLAVFALVLAVYGLLLYSIGK